MRTLTVLWHMSQSRASRRTKLRAMRTVLIMGITSWWRANIIADDPTNQLSRLDEENR